MASINKYKTQVIRLTQMLQNTFKQVQYYKKKDLESKAFKEKVQYQLDKLQEENGRLIQERDFFKQSAINEGGNQLGKLKAEYDSTIVMNKTKNYVEKVTEIIKEIAEQCRNRMKKSNTQYGYSQNLQSLERAFAKASMGVIKYQQQFIKQAANKEMMRLEVDKLRKENTTLYEMTSKLQENFTETDKVAKKLHGQYKQLKAENEQLALQNGKLKEQILAIEQEKRRKTSSRKVINLHNLNPIHDTHEDFESPNSHKSIPSLHSHKNESSHKYLQQIKELQAKIRVLEQQNEQMKQKYEENLKQKELFSFKTINDSQTSKNQEKKQWALKNQQLYEQIQDLREQIKSRDNIIYKLQQESTKGNKQLKAKIQDLQHINNQKSKEIKQLMLRIENSEVEKDKIITVYQNQSHESKDKIIRHQDALLEMEKVVKNFKVKNEELTKNNRSISKDLAQKNQEIQELMAKIQENERLLVEKNQQLQRVHCQREKQRLINEVNSKNFEDIDLKQERITSLQQKVEYLTQTNNKLEVEIDRIQISTKQQIQKYSKQKDMMEQKYQDNLCQMGVLQQNLLDKDKVIQKLQLQLNQINKQLNQISQTWGIDDSYRLLEAIGEKMRKQSQTIMDLTLIREKVINQNKNNELNYAQQKNMLKKEKEEILRINGKIMDEINKLFSINNKQKEKEKSEKSLPPRDNCKPKFIKQTPSLNIPRLQENDASFLSSNHSHKGYNISDDKDLQQKWNKILKHIEQQIQNIKKQREKINELQKIWWQKEQKSQDQLKSNQEQIEKLKYENEQLKQYIQLKQQQLAQKLQQIQSLQNKISNQQQKYQNNIESLNIEYNRESEVAREVSQQHHIVEYSIVSEYNINIPSSENKNMNKSYGLENISYISENDVYHEGDKPKENDVNQIYEQENGTNGKKVDRDIKLEELLESSLKYPQNEEKDNENIGNNYVIKISSNNDALEEQLSQYEEQIQKLKDKLQKKQLQIQQLRQQYEEHFKAINIKHNEKITELQSIIASHKQQISIQRGKKQAYKQQITHLKANLTQLKSNIQQKLISIAEYQQLLKQAKQHITQLQIRQEISYSGSELMISNIQDSHNFSIAYSTAQDTLFKRLSYNSAGDDYCLWEMKEQDREESELDKSNSKQVNKSESKGQIDEQQEKQNKGEVLKNEETQEEYRMQDSDQSKMQILKHLSNIKVLAPYLPKHQFDQQSIAASEVYSKASLELHYGKMTKKGSNQQISVSKNLIEEEEDLVPSMVKKIKSESSAGSIGASTVSFKKNKHNFEVYSTQHQLGQSPIQEQKSKISQNEAEDEKQSAKNNIYIVNQPNALDKTAQQNSNTEQTTNIAIYKQLQEHKLINNELRLKIEDLENNIQGNLNHYNEKIKKMREIVKTLYKEYVNQLKKDTKLELNLYWVESQRYISEQITEKLKQIVEKYKNVEKQKGQDIQSLFQQQIRKANSILLFEYATQTEIQNEQQHVQLPGQLRVQQQQQQQLGQLQLQNESRYKADIQMQTQEGANEIYLLQLPIVIENKFQEGHRQIIQQSKDIQTQQVKLDVGDNSQKLIEQIESSKNENKQLIEKLKQRDSKIQTLTTQIDIYKTQREEQLYQYVVFEKEIQNKKDTITKLNKEIQEYRNQIEKREEKIKQVQTQLEDKDKQLNEKQEQLEMKENLIRQRQEQMKALYNARNKEDLQNDEKVKDLEKMIIDITQNNVKRIKILEQQVKQKARALQNSSKILQQQKQSIQSVQNKAKQLQQQLLQAEQQRDKCKSQIKHISLYIYTHEKQYANMCKKLQEEFEYKIQQAMQSKVRSISEKLESIKKNRNKGKQVKNEEHKQQIEGYKYTIQQIEIQRDEYKRQYLEAETQNEKLVNKIRKLNQYKERREEEFQDKVQTIRQLTDSIQQYKNKEINEKQIQQLQSLCEKQREELITLNSQLEKIVGQNKQIQQQYEQATRNIANLNQQLKSIELQISSLAESKAKLEESNSIMQEQINQYEVELQNLTNRCGYLSKEVEELEVSNNEKEDECQGYEKEIRKLEDEIKKLKEMVADNQKLKKRKLNYIICKQQQVQIRNEMQKDRIKTEQSSTQTIPLQKQNANESQQETRIKQHNTLRHSSTSVQISNPSQKQQQQEKLKALLKQIFNKQMFLIEKQHEINRKINVLRQLQGKNTYNRENLMADYLYNSKQYDEQEDESKNEEKHLFGIRPNKNKPQTNTLQNNSEVQQIKNRELYLSQIPLQTSTKPQSIRTEANVLGGSKTNRQLALQKQLKITEEYKQILQAENKSLKKQILRKDKLSTKIKQIEKQVAHYKKCSEKITAELALKEKLLLKYDKEFKGKVEENVKLKRCIENLNEELDLQKKRNKNFEDLYDKYKMKKSTIGSPLPSPQGNGENARKQ